MATKKKVKSREVKFPLEFDGKTFVLVRYNDNYADEFDVDGWRVFNAEEYAEFKTSFPRNFTVGIGTNESIDYSEKDGPRLFDQLEETPITVDEAKTLYKLFGGEDSRYLEWDGKDFGLIEHHPICEFGVFPRPPDPDDIDEEDDEDED